MLTGSMSINKEPEQEDRTQSSQASERSQELRKLGLFTIIVSDLVGYTAAGMGLGYFAWTKWGAPWWVLLLSSVGGLSLAFYRIYQVSKKNL
jgi:hypothetical protein